METIEVVNRHIYKGEGEYVGRGTPLGNKHDTGNRIKDIADFRKDLWKEMHKPNSKMIEELNRLYRIWKGTGKLVLVCSCKPKACHADVIKSALLWTDAQVK